MKKAILTAGLILTFVAMVGAAGVAAAGTAFIVAGDYNQAVTPTVTQATVTGTAITTVAAVSYGYQRMFVNNGTGTIYMTYSLTTTTATITGFPIYTKTYYIEDKYFGPIYLCGDTASNDLRYVVFKKQ